MSMAILEKRGRTAGPAGPSLMLLSILAGAGLVGCGDSTTTARTVRDSAGVRIVENHRPVWDDAGRWSLGAPFLDIGGPDAAEEEAFQAVAGAMLLADGRVVVVEERGRIRFFDPDGAHIRTVGRPGDGPGEFRLIAGAGLIGDSIWLYDYFHRRLTFLAFDGELAGVRPLEGEDPAVLPVGPLAGGLLLTRSNLAGGGVEHLGLRRDTVPYLWFDTDGGSRTEIARLPGREYVVGEENGRATMASPPFVRAARHAARDTVWVHGDQERREIRVLDASGTARVLVRWPGPALVIDDRSLEAEIEARVARDGREDPGLRRFLTELDRPATRPAHGDLALAPDGHVWVGTAPGSRNDGPFETPGWHVFDSEGRWLGTVEAPTRFRITQILAERVVGVALDDLDVEHVQARPLVRP